MSCNACQAERARVMYFTLHPDVSAFFGQCGALLEVIARQVGRFLQAQWYKDVLLRKRIQILARDLLNDLAKYLEAHVAVNELLARWGDRLEREDALPGFFNAIVVILQRVVGDESSLVREEL